MYKKASLLAITIFGILNFSTAQNEVSLQESLFSYEIFGGPSFVSFKYQTTNFNMNQYVVPKIGFLFGIGVEKKFKNNISIVTRFQFERKGSKSETELMVPPDFFNNPPTTNLPPVPTKYKYNSNNDYLTITVIPKYSFGKGRRISGGVGIYSGLLLSAIYKLEVIQSGTVKLRTSEDLKADDFYKNYDFGGSVLVEYKLLKAYKTHISLGINWNMGLINIIENLEPGISPMRTNQIGIYLLSIL